MINTFENICIEKDKGYFFSFEINGLYELNLKNWKCKFLTAYDKLNDERLFSNIVKYKDWLVLIPMQADKFMAYNLCSEEKIYIDIPVISGRYKESAKFLSAHIVGDKLYAIGHSYPGIIKIDLIKWNIEKVIELSDFGNLTDDGKDIFRYSSYYDFKIIAPSAFDNKILILNTNDDQYQIKKMKINLKGFAKIVKYKNKSIGIPLYEKKLIIFDEKGSQYVYIADESPDSYISDFKYSNSLSYKNYEVIIPLCTSNIVIFNKDTYEIKIVDIKKITNGYEHAISPVRACFEYNSNIYIISGNNGEIFKLNCKNHELISVKKKIIAQFVDERNANKAFVESRGYSIGDYIVDVMDM